MKRIKPEVAGSGSKYANHCAMLFPFNQTVLSLPTGAASGSAACGAAQDAGKSRRRGEVLPVLAAPPESAGPGQGQWDPAQGGPEIPDHLPDGQSADPTDHRQSPAARNALQHSRTLQRSL